MLEEALALVGRKVDDCRKVKFKLRGKQIFVELVFKLGRQPSGMSDQLVVASIAKRP